MRRFRLAPTTQRDGDTLIGGSPLRMFRLTAAGGRLVDAIEQGRSVDDSPLVARLIDADVIHPVVGGPARFTAGDVTVVVPTLGPVAEPPPGAVIVDDGSDPPVPDAAVRLDTNRGPASARNAGLALVRTPLVAFVDADVTLDDDWLEALLGHFDDERVALVAPRVMSSEGPSALERHEHRHSPLDLGAEPARVRPGSRVSYVPAAALVARTETLRALGGFDESLRFGEDVDLVWRLDRAGWLVRYEPAAGVHHRPRSTWSAWCRQRIDYGSSAAPLHRRHPGSVAPVRISGWSLATWAAAFAVHPAVGVAIGTGTSLALVGKLRHVTPAVAFGLAARGNLFAGAQLAQAVRRVWWPLFALAAVPYRPARRALLASFVVAGDPRVALDDVAYSLGVWRGMLRERTPGPVMPAITSWPPTRRRRRHSGALGGYRPST